MQEHYGIDLDAPRLLDEHESRWLKTRLAGLLSTDSRLRAVLLPEKEVSGVPDGG